MRQKLRMPLRVARAALAALIALVLIVPALAPLVTGHRLIVVDGGSMRPTFDVGDVLVTAAPTGDDLAVGAILVIGRTGSLYTHRVVEVDPEQQRARLRGDANPVADPGWVAQSDVYAVYLDHLTGPFAQLVRAVTTLPGTLILLAVAIVLLLSGARDATRRRSRPSPRSPQHHDPRAAPGR